MSWIYLKSDPQLWTVGFYKPDGKFNPESDHSTEAAAASRVHWLNGGKEAAAPELLVALKLCFDRGRSRYRQSRGPRMKFDCEHQFPIDRRLPGSRLQAMKALLEKARQQAEEKNGSNHISRGVRALRGLPTRG